MPSSVALAGAPAMAACCAHSVIREMRGGRLLTGSTMSFREASWLARNFIHSQAASGTRVVADMAQPPPVALTTNPALPLGRLDTSKRNSLFLRCVVVAHDPSRVMAESPAKNNPP